MRRRAAIAAAAAVAMAAATARAEPADGAGTAHLGLLGGYSTYLDIYRALLETSLHDGPLCPFFPTVVGWWGDASTGPFVAGARLAVYSGGRGHGGLAVLAAGATLHQGPLVGVTLLPGVGVTHFSEETGMASWVGVRTGPVYSVALVVTFAIHDGLEALALAALDVLPSHPLPVVGVGIDGVLAVGIGFGS